MTIQEPSVVSGTSNWDKPNLAITPPSAHSPVANPGLEPPIRSGGVLVPHCTLRLTSVDPHTVLINTSVDPPGVLPWSWRCREAPRGAGWVPAFLSLWHPRTAPGHGTSSRDKVTNGCRLTKVKTNLAGGCFKPR